MLKQVRSIKILVLFFFVLSWNLNLSQHRGDYFAFQGLNSFNDNGVKATAMGGAVTALSGDVSYIFYNPAGLSNISGIQVTASANYSSSDWSENQNYRPNRLFVTLPFYLEGIYTPDPSQDGMYDHERLWTEDQLIDSSYVLTAPTLGLDPYSKEAADWQESKSSFTFNNFAIAIPFSISELQFTASAAYNNLISIEDYDRNETYLDPHIGYDAYGEIGRVNGVDTLIVNWSDFGRSSSGSMDNIALALSYKISKILNIGLGMNLSFGSSDDLYYLNRIGTFHLINQQRFRYWYTKDDEEIKGTSDYSSTRFNLGLQLDLDEFKLGAKVDLPYTLQKEWNYIFTSEDSISYDQNTATGVDKLSIPAIFNFGVSYAPVQNFIVSFDYEYAPFSKSTAEFEVPNPTYASLPDRHTIRIGADYTPIELISIMAGYRDIPTLFVPDGAAIQTTGPSAKSYTFGLSFNTVIGRFDATYEYRDLKYYDSYYSNTNYNTISQNNILFGYTLNIL